MTTGLWPPTRQPPLTLADDQVGAALTLAAVLLGKHPWAHVLHNVQVPPELEARGEFFKSEFFQTSYKVCALLLQPFVLFSTLIVISFAHSRLAGI